MPFRSLLRQRSKLYEVSRSHFSSVTIQRAVLTFFRHLTVNMKRFLIAAVLVLASSAWGQEINSVLKPPKGSDVALVVFEDLQCPQCRRAAPLVQQAVRNYKIPVVRHDFPLPMHNWSYDGAVMAHYFDSKSRQLGSDFRDYIFQHQLEINPSNLRQFAERFATEHKTDLPFVYDPQGKFAAEVNSDRDMGNRIGIHQTPTIYVVSSKGQPYTEVSDLGSLFKTIDAVKNR
jgi:protein-disulfide isomerase